MDPADPLASLFQTAANGAVNALIGSVNQTGVKQQASAGAGDAGSSGQSVPTWALVALGVGAFVILS